MVWNMTLKYTASDISLFAGLADQVRASLDRALVWRRFRQGDEIIGRQSNSRDVFFVVSGCVRVMLYSVSGREITLDDIVPGGYFGELAAIDGQPRSACVMAVEDSIVASLSDESFKAAATENPEITFAIMRRLAAVVRTASGRILDLSTLGANNRVHGEVLRLAKDARLNAEGQPMITPIPVHADIASRVSTTRETVARVMSDLARQGIVSRKKDHMILLDAKRLEAIVEEVRGEL